MPGMARFGKQLLFKLGPDVASETLSHVQCQLHMLLALFQQAVMFVHVLSV